MVKAAPLTNGDEVEPSTGPLSTEEIVSFKENGCEFCALSALRDVHRWELPGAPLLLTMLPLPAQT